MNLHKKTADEYIEMMKNGEVFSSSRFGDGEWLCISGARGHNCDFHNYTPELQQGLIKALNNNYNYFHQRWDFSITQVANNKRIIVDNINKHCPDDMQWYDANIWIELLQSKQIHKLIEQLNNMNAIFIGNESLKTVPINYKEYITIPKVNCFSERNVIKSKVLQYADLYEKPIFLFSASMASNVMIDELFSEIGDKCWMVDMGSIWEPLVGRLTRSYHRGLEWE